VNKNCFLIVIAVEIALHQGIIQWLLFENQLGLKRKAQTSKAPPPGHNLLNSRGRKKLAGSDIPFHSCATAFSNTLESAPKWTRALGG
jgi:hypothetical protein